VTFQELILSLQNFWAAQGCIIQQPYDIEKGAGTFNPATFLRALGPEPWNVAYVEPSRRPTDGRYGENPNRLQHYYQFQVILKPSPLNIRICISIRSRVLVLIPLLTTFALLRTIGNLQPWAPGAWVGRCGSMAWRLPSLPISSSVVASI